jgi:hypothetical protein
MDTKEYMKKWGKTPKGLKSRTISGWKSYGLVGDYEEIYNRYLNTDNCELCGVLFQGRGNDKKCMDHNHITGEFRNICCHKCNMNKQSKQKNNPNCSVGISFVKKKQLWKYRKMTDGITYQKMNKNLQHLLWHKFVYLLKL